MTDSNVDGVGDGGVFDQCGRHPLDKVPASQFAAGSLDKRVLTCQDLSVLGIKHRRELPIDLPGNAFHLLFHLHRDVPLGVCDGHKSHRRAVPMIDQSEASVTCTS